MKDEYLLLKQAAYLLQVPKQTFEYYVKAKKIKTELNRGRRMIKVTDLAEYVSKQLDRFSLAEQYFLAESKWMSWKLQPKKFNKTNRIVEDSMIEYLTLQQTAYLLDMSAHSIRYMVENGLLQGTREKQGKRFMYFIRADEVQRYVAEQKSRYEKVFSFLKCNDSFLFWEKYRTDFQLFWKDGYKERKMSCAEK